ncbi:MAG TPA: NAD+ synthase [Chloroflexota bacterium]|nr:NAD+ synthase [Chloroflexota bacterium]
MSARSVRVALSQLNSVVGDLDGNLELIAADVDRARAAGAEIVLFPELALTGYPPEDLLLKASFITDNRRRLEELALRCRGITVVVGFVDAKGDIYNAAAVIHDGEIAGVYHKRFLPNYGVFDEDRYFRPGSEAPIFALGDVTFGVNICEDVWYPTGPAVSQVRAGANLILNLNASPYHRGKKCFRESMLATRAADNAVIIAYTNMVGGQDELVFDGNAMVFDEQGRMIAEGTQFEESLLFVDLDLEAVFRRRLHDPRHRKEQLSTSVDVLPTPVIRLKRLVPVSIPLQVQAVGALDSIGEVYRALTVGTRDYVRKNGFRGALIGLSGGIDSSLVATIAADALGASNVVGVSMPSRYSSSGSKDDARELAENLGIDYWTIPIEPAHQAMLDMLAGQFAGTKAGLAEENLQSRLRGNVLMTISNKFGWIVLTTGNKSEMATGYATLYGDMAGGFAVLKDVPKTLVYELSEWRNQQATKPVVPLAVIHKEPSAELRPDQRDVDSLPPYEVLDPILQAYVEEDRSAEEIIALGFAKETVRKTIQLVDRTEYKRRQAPPGVKITPRAFGRDRRLPITNRYRGA